MGQIVRLYSSTLSYTGAGAYGAGDEVSTNVTAASTQRAVFDFSGFESGIIRGMSMAGNAATSWVVTANNLEALLFHSTDAPAAVGDNVTNPLTALVRQKAFGEFVFDDAGWVNQLGAVATGASGHQYALPGVASNSQGVTALFSGLQNGRAFSFAGKPGNSRSVIVVLRALAAWDPANEAHSIGFALDIEV